MISAQEAYGAVKKVAVEDNYIIKSQYETSDSFYFAVVPKKYDKAEHVGALGTAYVINKSTGEVMKTSMYEMVEVVDSGMAHKVDISLFQERVS